MIRRKWKMRNVIAVAICLAASSGFLGCKECDKNDPKSECYVPPVVEEPIDTSGMCTVKFQNMTELLNFAIWVDASRINSDEGGMEIRGRETWTKQVKAGLRTLEAEQTSGIQIGVPKQRKEEQLLLKTDSVYLWQFP